MAGMLILLLTYAHWIPAWSNDFFSLKSFNFAESVRKALVPAPADTLQQVAEQLDVEGETKPMVSFIRGLAERKQTGQGSLRVAYFGDSIIEGDLITSKLRQQLQLNYGGSGVGLVPITSIVNEFRKTIKHRFSRNWETLSFMNRGNGITPLGMIGYTFIPRNYYYTESVVSVPVQPAYSDTLSPDTSKLPATRTRKETQRNYLGGPAWVEYAGVDVPGGAVDLRHVRLFYSHAQTNSQVVVYWDDGPPQTRYLSKAGGVQMLDLSPSAPVKKIRVEFNPADPIHVYGMSFDEPEGVFVDNLSVRGFSGMNLDAIPAEYLRGFQQHLNYDLIVLQYGENVSHADVRDYSFYRRGMIKSIQHLQAAMPGVPILIVSAHDRSVRQNGVFQTSPDIPILVSTQSGFAVETGSAFWNMFNAMGGLNSMPQYVQASPPLANLDYTHFTRAGADKIALMLYKVLTTGQSD